MSEIPRSPFIHNTFITVKTRDAKKFTIAERGATNRENASTVAE